MAVSQTGSSTSASSLLSSGRLNVTGLASGMNTEEIIEGMTVGTRSKIAKVKQQQTTLTWKMEAFRGITDKLVAFSQKYTSYTSPATNLLSTRLFAKSVVEAQGANSSKVSVSGAGHDNISVAGVKQLAMNASLTTGTASAGKIQTSEIDLSATRDISLLEGGSLTIKYGNKEFDITLEAGKDYTTPEAIAQSLNEVLAGTSYNSDKNLSDLMKFTSEDGKLSLGFQKADSNTLEITGGSTAVLKGLGFQKGDKTTSVDEPIQSEVLDPANLTERKTGAELITGKSMTIMLDGVRAEIKFSDNAAENDSIDKLQNQIQTQLNQKFGQGRVSVTVDGGRLSMQPTDSTSVLKLSEASKELTGANGVLGSITGGANRINLNAKLSDAGFAGFDLSNLARNEDGTYAMELNGTKIEGITENTTVKELMELVNQSGAGVQISYMEMADRFSITSTVQGEVGKAEYADEIDGKDNLAKQLFGAFAGNNHKAGQDAILSIQYKGTDEAIEIKRASNTVDLEGMTVNLKGTFGTYGTDGKLVAGSAEAVSFTARVDDTKLIDAIKSFVKDYNDMIDAANTQLTTKPARDSKSKLSYQPLTDEQRENMSEKEIERWEIEAKKGLLFGDMDLRSMMSDFRFLFGSEGASMGIKVSSKYSDNGKLEFDEDAFRAALEKDPQKVQDFFVQEPTTGSKGGVMYRVKSVLDKYAKTEGATKGILIQRAGHSSSPLSMLSNPLMDQKNMLDKTLTRLEATLQSQQDRYYRQFTGLETFIQKMNVQSGYIQQQSGM